MTTLQSQQQEQHPDNNDNDNDNDNNKSMASSSLLAQALEVPSLDHLVNNSNSNSNSNTAFSLHQSSSSEIPDAFASFLPQHSDFTIPTSNAGMSQDDYAPPPKGVHQYQHSDFTLPTSNTTGIAERAQPPPLEINQQSEASPTTMNINSRRTILGTNVQKRYSVQPPRSDPLPLMTPPQSPTKLISFSMPGSLSTISPLTPAMVALQKNRDTANHSPRSHNIQPRRLLHHQHSIHETLHAQCLLLGIAFMAVWSPNNVMAPNLTQMAESFGMTETERDLYLGSYCALAVGVFSLPISALLGFMADFYSRKYLFVACVLGGSLASAATGYSQTFSSLFLARLVNGGCMSASVPVAFSLLGDLFSTEERNAASSGLTAMMGLGIIVGQVYSGEVGPTLGWPHPFYVSSLLALSAAIMVGLWVQEPARGAKEKVLQDMLQSGGKYERQLSWEGFWHAMRHNRSNSILLWQGFFTSLPWGIVFVFLNDFLSQEKGFSVPDATFMVMLFGMGCAVGGIVGGYIGQVCMKYNRSYLPLFMATSTFLGMFPFVGLLNSSFPNHHGYKAMAYSIMGGCIASLPSVNVRPCIINVNPPETRGAALTAANLLVTLGRGIGPSCITLMGTIFQMSRTGSFNLTLIGFWTITAIQLVALAKTLPEDQDAMEAELQRYAAELRRTQNNLEVTRLMKTPNRNPSNSSLHVLVAMDDDLVSIEDNMIAFDGTAARRSIQFMSLGIKELKEEISYYGGQCGTAASSSEEEEDDDVRNEMSAQEVDRRREVWKRQQQKLQQTQAASETTPLISEEEV